LHPTFVPSQIRRGGRYWRGSPGERRWWATGQTVLDAAASDIETPQRAGAGRIDQPRLAQYREFWEASFTRLDGVLEELTATTKKKRRQHAIVSREFPGVDSERCCRSWRGGGCRVPMVGPYVKVLATEKFDDAWCPGEGV